MPKDQCVTFSEQRCFRVLGGKVDDDPAKTESVLNLPVPKTVLEVQDVLGLVGFYLKFIQDFAKIARPLIGILKSTEFEDKYGTQ